MGTESNPKTTPKIVKLNKAAKLAEKWMNSMSGSTASEELNQLEFIGRPARLGLGAKEIPTAKAAAASAGPVERKLLAKVNAGKKSSAKDTRKGGGGGGGRRRAEENGGSESDDDDPEGRTSAVAKKRPLPAVTPPQSKKLK